MMVHTFNTSSQADLYEFKANLVYMANLKSARPIQRNDVLSN